MIVTRDGPKVFLYAAAEEQAREAERVARELVAAEGLSGSVALTRWHPDADAWKDAVEFRCRRPRSERAAEHQRHEEAAEAGAAAPLGLRVGGAGGPAEPARHGRAWRRA